VRAGLATAGHEPVDVRISREGRWTHEGRPLSLDPGEGLAGAGAVFPALHGPFGEDGTVQGLLELLDVPYVGAGVMASAVSMDKALFKDLMSAHGLPQVEYAVVRDGERPRLSFPLPVFVKPARLGSSVGISKATGSAELAASLRLAFEHDPIVVVERMAEGLEVECSVLGNSRPEASLPGQIVIKASDWYDYEAKYTPGGMELLVPAPVPEAVRERVRELAVEVFRIVGCAGMARVDFFVVGGEVLVNELNTIPGFTETSVYAKLFEASGVPYPQLLDRLVELAVERHREERRYRF
jgi:D-alanine-D-alanine ligase